MNKYLLLSCALLISIPAYADTDTLLAKVKNKDIAAVENLLNNGENVNEKNSQGNTALHYAVATGNVEMVKLLLSYNADINAQNAKGWSPLSIAEKKNVGEVYNILEDKIASDKAAAQAKIDAAKKAEEQAKIDAAKKAEEQAKVEIERKAAEQARLAQQKVKQEQIKLAKEQEKKAKILEEQKKNTNKVIEEKVVKKAEKKAEKISTVSNNPKNEINKKKKANKAKPQPQAIKKSPKQEKKTIKFKASALSAKINQGDEEVVYCLHYLGLQGEQKNMTVASGFYAMETGINKTRHDVIVAEAQKYFENASADDIKNREDICGKYITPKDVKKQNQIIRSINKSIGI